MPPEGGRARFAYLDWARGVAVLLMLEWHTADAWTRLSDRDSAAFSWVLILGGFAAPLFLWLAGVGVGLSAARRTDAGNRRAAAAAICRRGLEVFVLAFLFRLQAFIVSPGSHPISIFRVDILNVLGLSIVLAGVVWILAAGTAGRVVWYGGLAAAVALLTPVVRSTALVDALPQWIQWYLRPAGDLTMFTMLPWSGFVLAGAACGAVLASAHESRSERQVQLSVAAAGTLLVVSGHYLASRPSIYAEASFWTSSPTWFAMRIGILMGGIALIRAMAETAARWNLACRPLDRLGRSSLFVYWIHVELVYGYATWPLRRRLPLWATLVAWIAFSLLMYGAVVLRDRFAGQLRAARGRPSPRPVHA